MGSGWGWLVAILLAAVPTGRETIGYLRARHRERVFERLTAAARPGTRISMGDRLVSSVDDDGDETA